jgi:hypothetical protein
VPNAAKRQPASLKRQAYDPDELSDLIHSPVIGTGVGSYIIQPDGQFPAPTEPNPPGPDVSAVATLPMSTADRLPTEEAECIVPSVDWNNLSTVHTDNLPAIPREATSHPLSALVPETYPYATEDTDNLSTVGIRATPSVSATTVDMYTDPGSRAGTVDMHRTPRGQLTPRLAPRHVLGTVDVSIVNGAKLAPRSKQKLWITEDGDVLAIAKPDRIKTIIKAQSVLNAGEEKVYDYLFANGQPQEDGCRLAQIGYHTLADDVDMSSKTIQRIVAKLIAKDFLEIERQADVFSRSSTIYRVRSYSEVLKINKEKGRTHYAKVGPGLVYVRPVTDDIHSMSTVRGNNVGSLAPRSIETIAGKHLSTVVEKDRYLLEQEILEQKEQTTTIVSEALAKYCIPDRDVPGRMIQECRLVAPDVTADEIAHFVAEKGSLLDGNTTVRNPTGFLLKVVPKCMVPEILHKYRTERQRQTQRQEEEAERKRRALVEAGREAERIQAEYEAALENPDIPDEEKAWIKRLLAKVRS